MHASIQFILLLAKLDRILNYRTLEVDAWVHIIQLISQIKALIYRLKYIKKFSSCNQIKF